MSKKLTTFFEDSLKKDSLFINKKALQSNYIPKIVPYRDKQIKQIAGILAPALKMEKPSNLFIYGKTGTGKTLSIKYITDNILDVAKKNNINLKIIYLNCKLKKAVDTEYRLLANLAREFGKEIPATGLPTDEIYKIFLNSLDEKNLLLILILDEIDHLVYKIGDDILYNLTRLNSELKKSEISIIGLSNSLIFADNLDPRVKSSLSEEELIFPPYNALQLQKILRQRAEITFKNNSLGEGVIEKCAAYAAREHGDARRALELLRVAGEIAERENKDKVDIEHIDKAESKIDTDRIFDAVNTQPKQFKLTLYSIFLIKDKKRDLPIFTGDVYELYKDLCFKCGVRPLTQRRISDIISELDMLGIINTKNISKGRYGRTREICLAIPISNTLKIRKILEEALNL